MDPQYGIWQRVHVEYSKRNYACEVVGINENSTYEIIYANTNKSENNVDPKRISTYPHVSVEEVALIPTGTKIRLLWHEDMIYYIATILENSNEGKAVRIEYEDMEESNPLSDKDRYETLDMTTQTFQLYSWQDPKLNKIRAPKKRKSLVPGRKRKACRDCVNCNTPDCGICLHCKDKIKFGGLNTIRQRCIDRICLTPIEPTKTQTAEPPILKKRKIETTDNLLPSSSEAVLSSDEYARQVKTQTRKIRELEKALKQAKKEQLETKKLQAVALQREISQLDDNEEEASSSSSSSSSSLSLLPVLPLAKEASSSSISEKSKKEAHPPVSWSELEVQALYKGVKQFGTNWRKIKEVYSSSFQPHRGNGSLAYKYKTLESAKMNNVVAGVSEKKKRNGNDKIPVIVSTKQPSPLLLPQELSDPNELIGDMVTKRFRGYGKWQGRITSYNADTKKFYIVYETEVGNQIFHGAQEWYSYTELMKRKSGPVDECIDSSLSSSISSFSSSSSSSNMKQNSSSNMEQSDYPNFARMTERQQLHYLQVTTNGGDVNDGSKSEHDTNQKSKKTDNVNSDSSEADESEWL